MTQRGGGGRVSDALEEDRPSSQEVTNQQDTPQTQTTSSRLQILIDLLRSPKVGGALLQALRGDVPTAATKR